LSSPDRISPRVVCVLAAIGVALTMSASLVAQQPPPVVVNRSLPPPPPSRHAFGLLVDFSGGYDANVFADLMGSIGADQSASGPVLNGGVAMNYRLSGRKFSFGFDSGTRARYVDFNISGSTFTRYAAISQAYTGRTTRVWASEGISRAPAYTLQTTTRDASGSAVPSVPNLDRTVIATPITYGDFEAGLAQQLGRRSSLRLEYERSSALGSTPGVPTGKMTYANATFDRGVSRYMRLRFGYGIRQGQSSLNQLDGRTDTQELNTGIAYSRPLSFSRRTTFGFDTGVAMAEASGERGAQFIGTVELRHEFGRTWTAAGSYRRGLGGLDRFTETLFADIVRGQVAGQLSRRVTSTFTGSFSNAKPINGATGNFQSLDGAARLSVQLSRRLDWYSEGFYYHYQRPATQFALALPPPFDRYGVRTGVTLRTGSQSRQSNVAK
jgi:hypothetical protein